MARVSKLDRMRRTKKFAVSLTVTVPGHKRDYHRVFEGFDTRSAARTFKANAEKETKRRQEEYDWSVDGINPEHTFVWKVADVWAPISIEEYKDELERTLKGLGNGLRNDG